MSEEKTMQSCAFDAQDHFQIAKRKLELMEKCIADLHTLGLTTDQAGCVLEAQVVVADLRAAAAKAHVELQGLFAKLDAALAEEATRRR